ncbi:type VI secretion system baseplate subunit TssE [Pseudoduganella namucuonensis]|uniref:Type VI secretion system protein ImpF n=1 Tax=Pseudoduganella namucuonensis TaxID=1035707 RepID=A0A1I7KPL5_9BURK|nr:type VI secretion system baseplate subunit TssE [Pseudoduganella namucuonensis]SFU99382.1 type VI secretion system protein ImpF [Pseudoduganella namucuonensis]
MAATEPNAQAGAAGRLQPALLDRLVDAEPGHPREAPAERLITRQRLREAVLRDLAWLFNTTRLGGDAEFGACARARRSVVNFGLPALAGETASGLDPAALERAIHQAIVDFEPRVAPATLRVEALAAGSLLERHNIVSIRISGQLWAQPAPIALLLRTDVDLETGSVEIRDLGKEG